MEQDEKLKLDYEQTVASFHSLAEIRFKLLAIVPAFTGVAVGVIDKAQLSSSTMLALGVLGFLATLGIVFYDQRNTQLYDSAQFRAKGLEALMEFEQLKEDPEYYGGIFLDRPGRTLYLFNIINMWHDRGLALIYSAALGAWSFVLARGVFGLFDTERPNLELMIAAIVLISFFFEFHRHDTPTDPIENQYARIKRKLLTGKDVPYDMNRIQEDTQQEDTQQMDQQGRS